MQATGHEDQCNDSAGDNSVPDHLRRSTLNKPAARVLPCQTLRSRRQVKKTQAKEDVDDEKLAQWLRKFIVKRINGARFDKINYEPVSPQVFKLVFKHGLAFRGPLRFSLTKARLQQLFGKSKIKGSGCDSAEIALTGTKPSFQLTIQVQSTLPSP
eukprot:TRINITY_DN5377_c0_g1_i1.p1 TRINITY_DN5377_c0_g1~~TRINITY_DN5377_c0_g1_i1.p1  ORF type:complete len:156 (-),score=26.59 TRINITY_DN5377_c0_g1_i1:493-960(-)